MPAVSFFCSQSCILGQGHVLIVTKTRAKASCAIKMVWKWALQPKTRCVSLQKRQKTLVLFAPQVVSFGVHYCVCKPLVHVGVGLRKLLFYLFHRFALAVLVGRARIFAHGQLLCKPNNVPFFDVNHGSNQRYFAVGHVRNGLKSVQPSLVKQA